MNNWSDLYLYAARGNPEKLRARVVEILRSGRPIGPNTRKIIAELFDDKASSRFVATIKERKAGRPSNPQHVKWLLFKLKWPSYLAEANGKVESATQKAMEDLGITRAEVFKWRKLTSSKST